MKENEMTVTAAEWKPDVSFRQAKRVSKMVSVIMRRALRISMRTPHDVDVSYIAYEHKVIIKVYRGGFEFDWNYEFYEWYLDCGEKTIQQFNEILAELKKLRTKKNEDEEELR